MCTGYLLVEPYMIWCQLYHYLLNYLNLPPAVAGQFKTVCFIFNKSLLPFLQGDQYIHQWINNKCLCSQIKSKPGFFVNIPLENVWRNSKQLFINYCTLIYQLGFINIYIYTIFLHSRRLLIMVCATLLDMEYLGMLYHFCYY